jgi:hypothetical protein
VLLLLHNAQGVVGVSPGVPVFSLKVLSSQQPGMLSRMLAAVQWVLSEGVKQGIRVVNISMASYAAPGSKVRVGVCSGFFDGSTRLWLDTSFSVSCGQ